MLRLPQTREAAPNGAACCPFGAGFGLPQLSHQRSCHALHTGVYVPSRYSGNVNLWLRKGTGQTLDLSLLISDYGHVLCSMESMLPPKLSTGPRNCQLLAVAVGFVQAGKQQGSRPCSLLHGILLFRSIVCCCLESPAVAVGFVQVGKLKITIFTESLCESV